MADDSWAHEHGGFSMHSMGREKGNKKWVWETVPAGQQIVAFDEDLRHLVETLDVRMKKMLSEHEKDFFLAYKTHMYSVQKDFKALKVKADEEESKTRRDVQIQRLEKQLDWFMGEAMRLDELCKRYKKEVDKWKAKAEALDEDHRFLEDQIKGAKRQNKVLRAAVERAQTSAYSALVLQPQASSAGDGRSSPLPDVKRPLTGEARPAGGGAGRSTSAPLAHGGAAQAPGSPAQQATGSQVEQKYLESIRYLKQEIESERRTLSLLRAARANAYTSKTELEEFFLACIDEARKEINRRKYVTSGQDTLPPEKRKVLETLLTSEDVLVFLYEKLFPHRTGLAQQHVEDAKKAASGHFF